MKKKSPDIGLSMLDASCENKPSPKMKTTNEKLPQPIADYFQAANAHQTDAVVAAFAKDALVTDEHREHRGGTAIKEWSNEVNEKYQPHAEVTDVTEVGGKTVVTAEVSGSFPGSPVQLRYNFTLKGEKIAALLIEG
jgi:ketosteroid isomerase-like protein